MNIDTTSLAAKAEQVAAFCQALRNENNALREKIAGLESENRALAERMTVARERLEVMLDKLPAE